MKTRSKYPESAGASSGAELREAAFPPAEAKAMIRTQIYLSRTEYDFLQRESRRQDKPMAAVIRSLVDERMQLPEEAWENNALLAAPADPKFIGPEDGVPNHDHYIYGTPRKWMKKKGRWVETPPLPPDYYTNPKSAAKYDRLVEESK